MLIVGLTGGIGSGKSTVAASFATHGVPVVDADAVSHALTAAGGAAMPQIIKAFGADVADRAGALDRSTMRKLAFSDPDARRTLEAILHPLIRAESMQLLRSYEQAGASYALLVVPLLVESGTYASRCHRVLVIDCEEEVQISRVMQRSQLTREEVLAIMTKQTTRQTRLNAADDVINNSALSTGEIKEAVTALHSKYLRLNQVK
jgi:dephospho-CoA kinase